jgi:hypothetical protein
MLVTPVQRELFVEKLESREREIERQLSYLERLLTPHTVFMHAGAGDCALCFRAACYVERVYALDPTEGIARGLKLPGNLRFAFSKSTVPEGAVDVAFSDGFSPGRLEEVRRCLAPGGVYVFGFSAGRSLRELRRRALEAGFSAIRVPFFFNLFRQRFVSAVR